MNSKKILLNQLKMHILFFPPQNQWQNWTVWNGYNIFEKGTTHKSNRIESKKQIVWFTLTVWLNWIESRYTFEWRTISYTCERLVVSPMNKSMIPWMAWGNVYSIYILHTVDACLPADPSKCFCSRWSFMRIFYFKSGINVWFKWHAHFTIQVKPRKKNNTKHICFRQFSFEWMPEMHSQTMEENEIIAMEKIIFEIMLHGIFWFSKFMRKKFLSIFMLFEQQKGETGKGWDS